MKKKYLEPKLMSITIEPTGILYNSVEYGGNGNGRPADAKLRRKYTFEEESYETDFEEDKNEELEQL